MHEMSFAEQILENVLAEAKSYPGARVTRVKLRADELLALEPASLRFCLEAISVDTPMEGAKIEMREIKPQLRCPVCGPVDVESLGDPVCPQCGQFAELPAGMELVIEEIELDE